MSALTVTTWNVAAINNNPFEYWISYEEDPRYTQLMADVEEFIEAPGEREIALGAVVSDAMVEQLAERMRKEGWQGVDEVVNRWQSEYKARKIVSEFLKDKSIGSKRLTSMPDRFTNTINLAGGAIACRPTVINQYQTPLESLDNWFSQWTEFMFDRQLEIVGRGGSVQTKRACQLLQSIQKSKYPAISEEEEAISIPLQLVLLGAFDAVLVYMMNLLCPAWNDIKLQLCDRLIKHKNQRTIEILQQHYLDSDIICLQEVALAFVECLRSTADINDTFNVITPEKLDSTRDQNSVLLLRRSRFQSQVEELTAEVLKTLTASGVKAPIVDGDVLVVSTTETTTNDQYVVASFHGDTNGLATIPVLDALHATLAGKNAKLVFGLDANTYEKPAKGFQDMEGFLQAVRASGMDHCYGSRALEGFYTTFNARTFVQPQLNKACRFKNMKEGADINLKDFILFYSASHQADPDESATWRDNTGNKSYTENMVFPTISFPSDHAVVRTRILPK